MNFQNPIFKEGLNTTVRRGVKSYDCQATEYGEPIYDASTPNIDEYGNHPIGFAEVVMVKHFRLMDLTDSDLQDQHDEATRTVSGLLEKLDNYYEGLDTREIISLVYFYPHISSK